MANIATKLDKKVYKKLITDISSELSDKDTRHIAYHNDIKSYTDALDLFTQLERAGCIGRDNISELEELLTSVKRQDLVARVRDTIKKNEGRRVSQSLKLPEPEHTHIEKRANTISGPTCVTRPHQESGGSLRAFGMNVKHNDLQEFHPTTESIQENVSLTEGAETREQQSVQGKDRVDSPNSKKPRSRHSSERVGLILNSTGTLTQQSHSSSRSPSIQTTQSTLNTSFATSAYHSTSDLSSVSSHNNIPSTESERNFILISKILEVMNSTQATADSDTVSESGDEQSRQTTVEKIESRERSSTLCSRSENVFESSHESRESNSDHRHSSGLETSTELPSKGASKPSSHLPRRPSKLKVSRLLSWKKSRSRASSGDGQTLTWTLKRDQLNKPIFRHQQDHTIEWKKKVEVDVGNGSSFNPILSFILHPYGLEEDCRRYVTLEVRVAVPKKAPKLKKATCVKLTLLISEGQGDTEKKLREHTLIKHLDLRVFYQSKFISHRAIRESKSEVVNVIIQAEYVSMTQPN